MKNLKQLFSVMLGALTTLVVLGPAAALAANSSVGQYGGAGGEVGGEVASGAGSGAGAGAGSGSGSDSALAFTGVDVTTLLIIAVALVAAGVMLNRLVVHRTPA